MIAAVTMVKDEADVIEETVRWMADQVDCVIVADNGSTDGTQDILRALPVELAADNDPAYYQSLKMTALAHRARAAGATWVIPFDADEVWVSPHGRIADVLRDRTEYVAPALIYNYVATAKDDLDLPPIGRIRWRLRDPLPLPKVACRALPGLTIHAGNHAASFDGMDEPTVADGLLEVRHFPYRSAEQFVRKAQNGAAAYAQTNLPRTTGLHWREYGELIDAEGPEAGEAWFRKHFWVEDPENDPNLVLDPCPSTSSVPG